MSDQMMMELEYRIWSRQALKALGDLNGLHCGPLSPLARVAVPDGRADRVELIESLEKLDERWEPALPALLDPGLSLALIVADRDQQRLAQYLWTDPAGMGPGFKVALASSELQLAGPLTLEEVELSLLDSLALGGVAEVPPERFSLSADQFWALLALADAYGTAAAMRQAARVSGPPAGVTVAEVLASLAAGLARPNPGWALSLVALLSPDTVPTHFASKLGAALAELRDAGLLSLLAGKAADGSDDLVILGDGLNLLCRGLSAGGTGFGFVRSERLAADQIEVCTVTGWRTAGGFVLADLSALVSNQVQMLVLGPAYLVQLIGDLLGTRTAPETDTPREPENSTADLLERLRESKPARARGKKSAEASGCPACGAPTRSGARFCGQCGKPLS